ncbi:MAG: HAD family phosphatase [Oscillospiraceae bacterium]|nr:HAD family phosphatase [Oscillospiraceae bacterium]
MIDSVIFDLDGTLVNSMGVWAESDMIFLNNHGHEYSPELSYALRTLTFEDACSYIRREYSLDMSDKEIAEEITEIVRHKYTHEIELMPCVRETLAELSRHKIRMCVATSNSRELAEAVLISNGIDGHFEFLITSDEVGTGKNDPHIYISCAEKMGSTPMSTAVVEDSPHAAQTAHKAGFFTVGVPSGHYDDFDELEGCTDVRIENISELIGLISRPC